MKILTPLLLSFRFFFSLSLAFHESLFLSTSLQTRDQRREHRLSIAEKVVFINQVRVHFFSFFPEVSSAIFFPISFSDLSFPLLVRWTFSFTFLSNIFFSTFPSLSSTFSLIFPSLSSTFSLIFPIFPNQSSSQRLVWRRREEWSQPREMDVNPEIWVSGSRMVLIHSVSEWKRLEIFFLKVSFVKMREVDDVNVHLLLFIIPFTQNPRLSSFFFSSKGILMIGHKNDLLKEDEEMAED